MPFDPMILSSAVGKIPSMSDLPGQFNTLATNYISQKFSEKMYNKQYRDNIDFWNMQNAYNTPAMQMDRYRAAGLNPHLIYGQGSSGTAGPISTPDVQPVNFREPPMGGGKPDALLGLLQSADLRIKNGQADNISVQNELLRQDVLLKQLEADRRGFDLGLDKEMRDVSADARRLGVEKTRREIDVMTNRDIREAAMTSATIGEVFERTLNLMEQRNTMPVERERLRAEISNLRRTGKLQEMEIELRKLGINPSDPMWARYVGRFVQDVSEGKVTASTLGDSIWNFLFGK